jgi:membrane associated rhomboid family serine protease
MAQIIQCVFVPWSYIGTLMFAMYIAKLHFDEWVNDINLVRVWLFIESVYFFVWILSGALFALVAYIVKFKPTFKTEAAMAADDNVWNDKWSDDFLRFLKFDMYLWCFILSMLLMELYIGFGNMNHINEMGGSRTKPLGEMFGLMIISRIGQLLHNMKKMKEGKADYSDTFKD